MDLGRSSRNGRKGIEHRSRDVDGSHDVPGALAGGRRSRLARKIAVVGGLALLLATTPSPARAQDGGRDAVLGVGSFVCSLLYGPIKLAYAIGGTTVSGIAFLATGGNRDVAAPIFHSAVRGDYLVTPDHLAGNEPIEFVGRAPASSP